MLVKNMMSMGRWGMVAGLVGVLIACTDAGEDGEGNEEVEAGESDTTSTAGESESTAGESESTAGESESTAGESETGEPDAIAQACADACAGLEACGFALPGCEASCVDAHALFEGECRDAELAMTQCMATLACDELQTLLESVPGDPGTPCEQQGAALCGVGCTVYAVPLDSGCVVELECGEGEPVHTVHCEDQTCSCLVDGEVVGECASDQAICDMDVSAAEACCGWDLE